VVHDSAHGRIGVWSNFDKIEPLPTSGIQGFAQGHNAYLLPVLANQANFARSNLFVYAVSWFAYLSTSGQNRDQIPDFRMVT